MKNKPKKVGVGIYKIGEKQDEEGKMKKYPTETGEEIGIFVSTKQGRYGIYKTVLYNLSAQHFIMDNIEAVLAYC